MIKMRNIIVLRNPKRDIRIKMKGERTTEEMRVRFTGMFEEIREEIKEEIRGESIEDKIIGMTANKKNTKSMINVTSRSQNTPKVIQNIIQMKDCRNLNLNGEMNVQNGNKETPSHTNFPNTNYLNKNMISERKTTRKMTNLCMFVRNSVVRNSVVQVRRRTVIRAEIIKKIKNPVNMDMNVKVIIKDNIQVVIKDPTIEL